jgi:hypothetical protein
MTRRSAARAAHIRSVHEQRHRKVRRVWRQRLANGERMQRFEEALDMRRAAGSTTGDRHLRRQIG